MAKKSTKKKIVRGSSRYREVQKILSSYTKENGIKLGKEFNKAAGAIHRSTVNTPLKYVQQNIDRIYLEFSEVKIEIPKEFPSEFPFYDFINTLLNPMYDGVVIGVKYDELSINFKGSTDDVESMYKDSIHAHLRANYNDSPVAMFKLVSTDNKTFVNYVIETDKEIEVKPEGIAKEEETTETLKETSRPVSEEVELLQERRKLAEVEERVLIEKRKNAQMYLELVKSGLTKDEAMKILGL